MYGLVWSYRYRFRYVSQNQSERKNIESAIK